MPLVKSAQRVADLLELVAQHPPGLSYSELLAASDLPKSSLHALLTTLVHEDLLRYNPLGKRYGLGSRLFAMASGYAAQFQIAPAAWPYMAAIRDELNETVQLAVLNGPMVVYLAKVESRRPMQLASAVGSRLPAYATGIGQALLATLSDTELDLHIPSGQWNAFTEETVTSRAQLRLKLENTRRAGYATDLGEYSPDTRCVAVPVLDKDHQAVGAISISVSASRFDDVLRDGLAAVLSEKAYALSQQLGASDPGRWHRQSE
jgi:DNA-binding IclR family transcriptional regulator